MTVIFVYIYRYFTRQTYRYETMSPRGAREAVTDIGRWRYVTFSYVIFYFVVSTALPAGVLILLSFMPIYKIPTIDDLSKLSVNNYIKAFEYPMVTRALVNSIFLAIVGATFCVLLCALISYITLKTEMKGRSFLETITFLPYSTPSMIMAVGLLWAYIALPIGIYGTIWILMIGFITRFMPFGIRSISASLLQVHKQMEESSRTSGASWLRTFYSILLPLMKPGLIGGWILLSIIFARELSIPVLLSKAGSEVISIVIFDMYLEGQWEKVSALSVILLVITFMLTIIALRVGRARLEV